MTCSLLLAPPGGIEAVVGGQLAVVGGQWSVVSGKKRLLRIELVTDRSHSRLRRAHPALQTVLLTTDY
jgi:hypothetical protein